MSTTLSATATPIASYSTDEQFYATRYKQGGRDVYLIALTPLEIINNILRPNPDAPNPGNRRIRLSHARGFAQYYLENDNWVIPGIILRAPAIFDFQSNVEVMDPSIQFGVVSYPKRKQAEIDPDEGLDFAFDHDTKALEVELRNEAEEIAKESKARAKKATSTKR